MNKTTLVDGMYRINLKALFGTIVLGISTATLATICPDGSYVSGPRCNICPDGSYVSGRCKITPGGSYVGGSGRINICPDGSYVSGRCQIMPDGSYVGR